MKNNKEIIINIRQCVKRKEYKKALSYCEFFKYVYPELSEIVKINIELINKKLAALEDSALKKSQELVMEIRVFNNREYTVECFEKIIENSPVDVKIDLINGTAEHSYLLAWYSLDDFSVSKSPHDESDIKKYIRTFFNKTLFFDSEFYINQYKPNLNGLDPLEHFVQYGYEEKKLPARWFDIYFEGDCKFIDHLKNAQSRQDNLSTTEPKVSVLVPVYNNSQYLHECLDSIINQTLKELEIIIINDGSTDKKTIDILDDYAKKDSRIRLIHKKNTGYGHSMNCGLRAATGKYIGIVESDDFVTNTMFSDLYIKASQHNVDVIKADFFRFIKQNAKIKKFFNPLSSDSNYYNRIINPAKEKNIFSFPMNTWSGIYSKDFIVKNNIMHNETPGASFQDNGFWFQTFCFSERVLFVNHPYYLNRRDNSDSSIYSKSKLFSVRDEYAFIYNIITKDKKIKSKFIHIFNLYKYKAYCASINRSDDIGKLDFIKIFSEEFSNSFSKGEIDLKLFSSGAKKNLEKIVNLPEQFYQEASNQKIRKEYFLGIPIDDSFNTKKVKISVIVPAYNASEHIDECLQSILLQKLQEIEIICIDDGSTDRTFEKLLKYQDQDSRVVVRQQNNSGAGAARNHALSISNGKYVAFMDANDFYPSRDILETLYAKAEENIVNICGGSFSHYKNGIVNKSYHGLFEKYCFNEEKKILYNDYQFDYGYTRFIYKLSFLNENNIYFPNYKRFQDPPFFVNAMTTAKEFYVVPMVTYCYRKSTNKVLFDDQKTNDVVRGCIDNLKLSNEKNMCLLHKITLDHIDTEFFEIIMKSLYRQNIKLIELLIDANSRVNRQMLVECGYTVNIDNPYIIKPLKSLCSKKQS